MGIILSSILNNYDIRPTKKKKSLNSSTKRSGSTIPVAVRKKPIRIGGSTNPEKWRCGICTFLNDNDVNICTTCDSEKGEQRQSKKVKRND